MTWFDRLLLKLAVFRAASSGALHFRDAVVCLEGINRKRDCRRVGD